MNCSKISKETDFCERMQNIINENGHILPKIMFTAEIFPV